MTHTHRKTKIVCTLGPATDGEGILRGMLEAGMNVARFNFSHGDYAGHKMRLDQLKALREELNLPVAALLDTKGPEVRLKTFVNGSVLLKTDSIFTLHTDEVEGNEHQCSITYADLPNDVKPGDSILLDDGLVRMVVLSTTPTTIQCKVLNDGLMKTNKGVNIPGIRLSMPYVSEKDKEDILFGIEQGFDFIAASFVRTADDVRDLRKILNENDSNIRIIAKIENREGVNNLDEILSVADGIMVARGDMGVEIAFEKLPTIQKKLITKCRMMGKRVITATEMLESMIHNPRPTRAEISDVANAVYDGTSAIMLSGETAAGKYPVQAVKTMAKIAKTAEESINYRKRFYNSEFEIRNNVDAISHSTCGMAIDIDAKAIVACSLSGMTARMVSRFRSPVDILGLTTDEGTWRKLALSWGVTPAMCEKFTSTDVLFYTAKKMAVETLSLKKGDHIVITGGAPGDTGNTSLIKIESI